MTWGNVEAVRAMARKIANREGIGDLLAEGVKRASEKLGREPGHSQFTRSKAIHLGDTTIEPLVEMVIPVYRIPALSRLDRLGYRRSRARKPTRTSRLAGRGRAVGQAQRQDDVRGLPGYMPLTSRTTMEGWVKAVEAATGWKNLPAKRPWSLGGGSVTCSGCSTCAAA